MSTVLLAEARSDLRVVLSEADDRNEVVLCQVDIVLLSATAETHRDVLL